jgi:electron transfer DM13
MRRKVLVGILLVGLVAAWAAFRPERLWINKTVNETLESSVQGATATTAAAAEPQALAAGSFHKGAHETMGAATIYRLASGKRVLRLTNFTTSNGPEVHVYLVKAQDAMDNDTVKNAGFLDLGSLKGNVGDQNYDLPDDEDLETYRAVTIWCRRFGVNFGTAPLTTAAAPQGGPMLLRTGSFHSGAHETHGSAEIYQLAGGRRVLRFTNFETSNGPDVQVYLVAAQDATDNDTVKKAGFIPVAALKGNVGDQNYDLPDGVDLDKYSAVTIWCRRFGVNFGTAPLRPMSS